MKRTLRLKKIILGLGITAMLGICVMSSSFTYKAEASVFTEEDMAFLAEADAALREILAQKPVMGLVYLTDYYELRAEPGTDASAVVRVASGQQVQIQKVVLTEELEAWVQVSCTVRGTGYTGYVNRQNLACSDELFLDWEAEYGMNPAMYQMMSIMTVSGGDTEGTAEPVHADIEQFPESYQEALYALKEAHPTWTFVKMNTELNWDTVVAEELKSGRSLIYASNPTSMKEGLFGQKWYYASEEALEFYLDPRNGLTESLIFQFEHLTYNESYHTEEAVQRFLNHTFMKGQVPGYPAPYAFAITVVGREFNISPFHLATRIYQEQGDGTSPLISGTYPGYEGYYNYYNIGATGATDKEVIENGLAYAKKQNWDSHYHSIHFGAEIIASNYVDKGQDTLYLQKFDVDDSDGELYWHQYMQNIGAPSSEGANIKKLYEEAGSLDNAFVFKIPVFENMPESVCQKPVSSNRVVLDILEGYRDLQVYMDGVPVTAVKKNGYYVAEAPDNQVNTAVMYQYNENNVPVGMSVWELEYDGSGYLVKEVEGLKDLLSFHGFSVRITGRSGIRFKSGIAQETKTLLTGKGIDGYIVKEYGTLLLPKAMLGNSMLTLSTEQAATGLSYGTDASGNPVNKVLELVDGRERFASVLVGLPVSQYKTEVAFRAYITLTKNGEDITIYGPQNAKSIYDLSQQLLNMKIYPEGSTPDVFLKKVVSDADNYVPPTQSGSESSEQGTTDSSVSDGDAVGSQR